MVAPDTTKQSPIYNHLHRIASSPAWLPGSLDVNSRDEKTAPGQDLDLSDENIAHGAVKFRGVFTRH